MWYEILIQCYISLYRCGLLFSKGNLHNLLYLSLVPVNIILFSFMMWKFVCVKIPCTLYHSFCQMEINKLCVSPDRIWPYLDFGGICVIYGVHSLVGIIVPSFSRPIVIGALLSVVCSWVSLVFI